MDASDDGTAALRALVDAVTDTDATEPFGAYAFAASDPGAELGRHVERAVLLEAFGNTPEQLAEEYGPYEEASLFFCIVDHHRRLPAGVVRIIVPAEGGPGFKTLDDLPALWGEKPSELFARSGVPFEIGHAWDIATLAVSPEYRSAAARGLVSLGLYQSGLRTAEALGVELMVAILDRAVYRMSKARFHEPFQPLAEARPYLGSAGSLPVFLDVAGYRARLARVDQSIHDIIYEGSGLEAAMVPLQVDDGVAVASSVYGTEAVKRMMRSASSPARAAVEAGSPLARVLPFRPTRRAATG